MLVVVGVLLELLHRPCRHDPDLALVTIAYWFAYIGANSYKEVDRLPYPFCREELRIGRVAIFDGDIYYAAAPLWGKAKDIHVIKALYVVARENASKHQFCTHQGFGAPGL